MTRPIGQAEFLHIIQSRTARSAVGPSAVRGRGNTGTMVAARKFLRELDLARFTRRGRALGAELDTVTLAMCRCFPKTAQHWGVARKVLNIFLRDCLYTTYLKEHYRLEAIEAQLELPLDSITARSLKQLVGPGVLPRWLGVKGLSPESSAAFQAAASVEAKCRGIARVHLDAFWWSVSRDIE